MKKIDYLTAALVCLGLAQNAWATDVISINFGSGQTNASMSDQEGNDGSLLKDIPASSWNDFNDNSATDAAVAHRWNGTSQEDLADVTVSFSGRGGNWYPHAAQRSTTSRFLNGYIDDAANNQVSITVKNVPYSTYGVIIYYNGDNSGHRFKPVEVNGSRYTIQQGKTTPVASDAKSPIWGLPEQTTVGYGKNAIRIEGLTGTELTIRPGIFETVDGSQCRGTVAAVQIFDPATVEEVVVDKNDVFSASAAEDLEDADIYNLTIPAGGTFTVDADLTRSYNLISTGKVTLKGSHLTADNVAKLNNLTTGFIFRIEGAGSTSAPMNFGPGSYSFPEATVGHHDGNYVIYTVEGDQITIEGTNDTPRNGISYDINGGNVQIGTSATAGFWTAVNGTYNQTAGTVTALQNSPNQNGTGDGLLLGYSGSGFTSMNISGGDLLVENSSLQLFLLQTLNLSGTGHIKAKGVFMGNGDNHTVVLSDKATFELGSLGWKGVKLTLNGGKFKAYESTTMAGAITLNGAATVEVGDGLELTINNASGSGVLTKTGDGVIVLGTAARPTMNVAAGSVKIIASSDEIAAKQLVLPIPADAASLADGKMSVVDEAGTAIMFTAEKVGNTIVVTLVSNIPVVTETTTISALPIAGDAAGLLIIQGAETEDDAITVDFDTELPAGVNVSVKGFVNLTGSIPFAKMTFENNSTVSVTSLPATLPTGVNLILQGNDDEANPTAFGAVTIPAGQTVKTKGHLSLTLTNNGTFTIVDGCAAVTASAQAVKGTVNIAAGAKMINASNDAIAYNGGTTVNVRGELAMGSTRWTIGGSSIINLYGGCSVSGSGEGGRVWDLYRTGDVITVNAGDGDSTIVIDGVISPRNTTGSNIVIGNNMKLSVTGGFLRSDADGVVNRTGGGHFTGTIPLKGNVTVNLGGNSEIPARFVAVSGAPTLKWFGDGSVQFCNNDTKDDPVITVDSGATLNIDGKDFSGWNGGLTEHGWIVNNGILVFKSGTGSRFWREHIVMGNGSTVKIDNGDRALLMYGGAGTVEACQFMLPEGTATIQSGTEGDKAVLYLGNDGSGGWGSNEEAKKAVGFSVGAEATLTVTAPIKGNQPLVKHGAGQLKLTGNLSGYTGSINLKAGTVFVATDSGLAANKITTDLQGMKVTEKDVEGGKLYKVSPKSFTISIR